MVQKLAKIRIKSCTSCTELRTNWTDWKTSVISWKRFHFCTRGSILWLHRNIDTSQRNTCEGLNTDDPYHFRYLLMSYLRLNFVSRRCVETVRHCGVSSPALALNHQRLNHRPDSSCCCFFCCYSLGSLLFHDPHLCTNSSPGWGSISLCRPPPLALSLSLSSVFSSWFFLLSRLGLGFLTNNWRNPAVRGVTLSHLSVSLSHA